jgi:hypothetical protein
MPAVFYIHPWEIDPGQPRMNVGMITRVRHYRGLSVAEPRLRELLNTWKFAAFDSLLEAPVAAAV